MDSLVVIPTYNERENIVRLIVDIFSKQPLVHILVVDDRSPDGTADEVEQMSKTDGRIRLMVSEKREGYGRSMLSGFRYALLNGYRYVVTMDADFSHAPEYLSALLDAVQNDCSLVVGSRYMNGTVSVVNWPLSRLALSVFANRYVRLITGLPIADCTSGYRALRKEVIEAIGIDRIFSNGYSFISEVNYRAFRSGFKLKEVPIIFIERRQGASKMSKQLMIEAAFTPWKLRFGL